MIVAELALEEERHGEASKEVKMPHQYSGKFFVKRENKNQKHQNSNIHQLYIAEILTKLRVIYDAMVWKVITTGFRNGIASIYIQEVKERDALAIGLRHSGAICLFLNARQSYTARYANALVA